MTTVFYVYIADIGNPSVHEAEELLDSSSESDQSSSDSDSWEDEDPLYVVQIKKVRLSVNQMTCKFMS